MNQHTLYASTTPPPSARPWDVGVAEEALCELLKRLTNANIPLHALLISRHGKLIMEGYFAPYEKNTLHRMFSVCKTLNALAIGLLEAEGKLSLADRIIDYFPDKVPETIHPFIQSMTIRDLLMMRTCHSSTTYKYDTEAEWVESFFTAHPTHKPGTVFRYDTSSAHVLCCLVQRLSGQTMLDYLKDRVLRKIGWSEESYVLLNSFGDLQGGSGLMCTPMDLLLLGQLLLQNGKWNKEQLLPKNFVKTAISHLSATTMTGPSTHELPGYGYQIWRGEQDNFVLYGLGGQFVICFPRYQLVCVTNADTQNMAGIHRVLFDCIYDTLLPAIDLFEQGKYPMPLMEGGYTAYDRLQDYLKSLHIKAVCEETHCLHPQDTCQADIINNTYSFSKNEWNYKDICLSFDETNESGCLTYTYQNHFCQLYFGTKQCQKGIFPVYNMVYYGSGGWISPNTFFIKCHLADTSVGSIRIELCFTDRDIHVFLHKVEETMFQEYLGELYGSLPDQKMPMSK